MRWRTLIGLLIGLAFLTYLSSLPNALLWDDEQFIYRNVFVTTFDLPQLLSQNMIAGAGQVSNYYRPLTSLSFALDHLIWKLNPIGFHLTNTWMHVIAGAFLLLVFRECAKWHLPPSQPPNSKPPTPATNWLIWLVPLIFLVHPIQTEAVVYASSRGDSFSALLLFTALYTFCLGLNRVTRQVTVYDQVLTFSQSFFFGLSAFLFATSLFTKESAIVGAGLFALIYGWFCLVQLTSRSFQLSNIHFPRLIPGLLAVATVGLISLSYLGLRATVLNFHDSFNFYGDNSGSAYAQNLTIRLATFSRVQWTYWQLLIWPHPLHMERDIELVTSLINPWLLSSLVVYFGWLLAGWWEYRQRHSPWIWFGLGWWWITILPFTGLIPINGILYEHWLYIPLVGFFTAVGRSGQLLVAAIPVPMSTKKRVTLVMIALWTVLAMGLTIRQNFLWSTPIRLYEYLLTFSQTARLHNNLAMAYTEAGQRQAAIEHYHKALQLDANYPEIHHNLGNTFYELKQFDQAASAFEQAVALNPQFGFSYPYLINIYLTQKSYTQALAKLETYQKIDPQNPQIFQLIQYVKSELAKPSKK